MRIEKLPTAQLRAVADNAEAEGDWDTFEAAGAELGRRDYDAADPASPQNTAADARDSEPRAWYADEIDGYDRNGAFDGFNVYSDADPGL